MTNPRLSFSYCHGVTPAGHTLDQALAGWDENVVAPLQQFGKKVFGVYRFVFLFSRAISDVVMR
jgi:hypothetical protein